MFCAVAEDQKIAYLREILDVSIAIIQDMWYTLDKLINTLKE